MLLFYGHLKGLRECRLPGQENEIHEATDGIFKTCMYYGSRTGRIPPSRETNGHIFLKRPRPTKGCRADDDDDDDDGGGGGGGGRHFKVRTRTDFICGAQETVRLTNDEEFLLF